MKRKIIEIDKEKCTGCGQCINDCAEGALAIVNGKAELISDVYCDGLGACLKCPEGALKLIEREAEEFNEEEALKAKKEREKNATACKCPGSAIRSLNNANMDCDTITGPLKVELPSWPIQLRLMHPSASFLNNANILLAAHCSAFSLPSFHSTWLKGRIPLIACPKLDPYNELLQHLGAIIESSNIAKITILRMSVPCCGGLQKLTNDAMEMAKKNIPIEIYTANLS